MQKGRYNFISCTAIMETNNADSGRYLSLMYRPKVLLCIFVPPFITSDMFSGNIVRPSVPIFQMGGTAFHFITIIRAVQIVLAKKFIREKGRYYFHRKTLYRPFTKFCTALC